MVPQWLANKLPCYKAIIDRWVSDTYKVEHAEAAARRAQLGEGVHRQGNLTLIGVVQNKVKIRLLFSIQIILYP